MRYVQTKSCSDVWIIYKIRICRYKYVPTFHMDDKSIDGG